MQPCRRSIGSSCRMRAVGLPLRLPARRDSRTPERNHATTQPRNHATTQPTTQPLVNTSRSMLRISMPSFRWPVAQGSSPSCLRKATRVMRIWSSQWLLGTATTLATGCHGTIGPTITLENQADTGQAILDGAPHGDIGGDGEPGGDPPIGFDGAHGGDSDFGDRVDFDDSFATDEALDVTSLSKTRTSNCAGGVRVPLCVANYCTIVVRI